MRRVRVLASWPRTGFGWAFRAAPLVALGCFPPCLAGTGLAISTPPQSQTIEPGKPVTFTVATTGQSGTLTYTWMIDGVVIVGANAASYTLPAVTAAQNGAKFTVKVKDASVEVTSDPAVLVVGKAVQPWVAVPDGTEANPASVHFLWGQENSNLYRQDPNANFFSGSKGMLELDIDNRFTLSSKPGFFLKLDLGIGLRGAFSTSDQANANAIVSTSQNFFASVQVAPMYKSSDRFAVGFLAGITWAAYPVASSAQGNSGTGAGSTGTSTPPTVTGDDIRSIASFGVATETAFGAASNLSSTGGIFFQIDPLYAQPRRLDAIGRLTYYASVNIFLEGELNKGLGSTTRNPGRLAKDAGFVRFGIEIDPKPLLTGLKTLFTPNS